LPRPRFPGPPLSLALAPAEAIAQDPYVAAAQYNQARAYRQFLTSPAHIRTYSGGTPGLAMLSYDPYGGYSLYERGPSYTHQRIDRHGLHGYRLLPAERRVYFRPVPVPPPPYWAPGPPAAYPWR
jgi:hypothetical protein